MKNLSVRTIVAIGIGAALFFVLARFVAIPSPVPNTSVTTQYGLLAFMSALFGPVAGILIGFIGHFLNDLSAGWGIWWSWVICSGIFGLLVGIGCKGIHLEDGEFGTAQLIRFNIVQAVSHLICWAAVAPTLDILMYQEPANKVYLQGLVASAANIVTTAIIGTILCAAYAKTRPQAGSLNRE
jgi:energy-coupling factor transport system substrate-specific component